SRSIPRNTSARPKLLFTPRNRTNGSGIRRPLSDAPMIAQRPRPFTMHTAPRGALPLSQRASGLEFALPLLRAGSRGNKQSGRSPERLVQLRSGPGSEGHQSGHSQGQGGRHHGPVWLRKNDAASPYRRRPRPEPGRNPRRRPVARRARPRAPLRAEAQDGNAVPIRRPVHGPVVFRERRVPDARAHRPAGVAHPRPRADEAPGGGAPRRGGSHALGTLRRNGAARGPRPLDRARSDAHALRRALYGTR